MADIYQPLKDVKKLIEDGFPAYWEKLFHRVVDYEVIADNGFKVITKADPKDIHNLKRTIKRWEKEVRNYRDYIREILDLSLFDRTNPEAYSPPEFKDDIFANELWTVSGALKSPDPDLKLYKIHFYATTPMDVFVVVENILTNCHDYMEDISPNIKLNMMNQIDQLKMDFLDEDSMLLTGVIGLGIRSEMLHRLYPSHFAIMTRRSLWGMFYLCNEAEEFVVDEENDIGRQRTSSNWEYDYVRFCFLNNFIANLVETILGKSGIKMDQSIRFGYVNMFLNEIFAMHRKQIDVHMRWK